MIDNSNKYGADQKFSSQYPIQFYALGKDDFEDRLILGNTPV